MADPPERENGGRVKVRILIPFILVLVAVVGAFATGAYLLERRSWERSLESGRQAVNELMRQEMINDTAMMRAIVDVITRDPEMQAAFISRDRTGLLERITPLFDELRQQNRVSHLYFNLPDRTTFLRAHQPDAAGDVIDRITAREAEWTGRTSSGLELGTFGTFTLRVVTPWRIDGRLAGYVELGHDIDHFIREIHEILDMDFLVVIEKRFLDFDRWQKGVAMLGHHWDWNRYPTTVLAGRTMADVPDILADMLAKASSIDETTLQVAKDGRLLYLASSPLADAAMRNVGRLIMVRDVTDLRTEFRDTMIVVGTFSLAVGGIAFVFFFVILGQVERDYRRQREVEQELYKLSTEHRRVVQMEKLSAVGMMMGEIAHQINNPLVGVLNMAQLAEREQGNPEHTRELLAEIRGAGEHCRAFVQRMLEFTRISRSDRKPTEMGRLIHDTISLFQQSVGNRARVVSDLPRAPVSLEVDRVLIGHALFNLLTNAGQAMSDMPTGMITVRLHPERRREDGAAGWCLSVQDQGPGIPADIMDRIFTPFFSTRPEGTGMGLPVVQHIAVVHGGYVTAVNDAAGGAHFALWLPDTSALWLPETPAARLAEPTEG